MAAVLTVADLHAEGRAIAPGWAKTDRWRWLDAVAWIATRKTPIVDEVMGALRGYRDWQGRNGQSGEDACWTVALGHVQAETWNEASRELTRAVEDGEIDAIDQASGLIVECDNWIGRRVPLSSLRRVPLVTLASKDVRRLWPAGHPIKRGAPTVYDAESFIAEAVRQLDQEGDYGDGWRPHDLMERMEGWCFSQWKKAPGETWIKGKCAEARRRFLEMRRSI